MSLKSQGVVGLIPAAGASRRMGTDKRRLLLAHRTLLETTVKNLRDGGIDRIVVILEPDSPCRTLAGLADCRVAINAQPERGMLSSIRCGLETVLASEEMADVTACALQPGDHALAPPEVVRSLCETFLQARPLLLTPTYPRVGPAGQREWRRGHPLLMARELFAEAMACDDAVGLRQLVRRRSRDVVELPFDVCGADTDVDTPDDLRRLRARLPPDEGGEAKG